MFIITVLAFVNLSAAFLSLWIKKDLKIWGSFLSLALFLGAIAGHITAVGLGLIFLLFSLWFAFFQKQSAWVFFALVFLSMALKMRLLPGFFPYMITPKFGLGLEGSLIGLFPLAFVLPLAKTLRDWKEVWKGFLPGFIGILLIAGLAVFFGAVRFDLKIPAFMWIRTFSNLILTSIPEEGFYRGFVQNILINYFKNNKLGKILSLLLTSLLFSFAHIYWSPNLALLAFTFLASLLYGAVYLFSNRIESAILCHFTLNMVHMLFYSYHAA